MEQLLVEGEPGEIWVLRAKRRWVVRVDGEDFETQGGKEDATARAFSIAQLGDAPQDVVIFGRNGSIEGRRTFRPRSRCKKDETDEKRYRNTLEHDATPHTLG